MQTFFLCVQNTEMDKVEFVTYDNAEWEGKNTHSKGERVKIPLLPYNVDKKSFKNSGPTVGSRQYTL